MPPEHVGFHGPSHLHASWPKTDATLFSPKVAADRIDPPDRLVGSVDSTALCNTGSYARPPAERDKSDSGLVDAERFQVPFIFTAAGSVDSRNLLVLKLALDHTFGSQGRPPVERDKTELAIWKGDVRKSYFFEENGATPTAGIPEEADTPFEGDPVGVPRRVANKHTPRRWRASDRCHPQIVWKNKLCAALRGTSSQLVH